MKLNNIFMQLILSISISAVTTSCSSLHKYTDTYDHNNNDRKNIKSYYFNAINIKNNKVSNKQIQLKMQELKSCNIVYFPLDQYNISSQFFYALNIHADFLCKNPTYCIKVEGHTDERGTPEYNIALGERRANSVKLYLQSQGVLSEQIFTVSYGKEKPAVLGHNEEVYSKNRRVVILTYK